MMAQKDPNHYHVRMEKEKSQLERFKEAARDIEADTSDDALDKIMGKLDLKKKEGDLKSKPTLRASVDDEPKDEE